MAFLPPPLMFGRFDRRIALIYGNSVSQCLLHQSELEASNDIAILWLLYDSNSCDQRKNFARWAIVMEGAPFEAFMIITGNRSSSSQGNLFVLNSNFLLIGSS